MASKRTCPECHLVFEASSPETGVLSCPLCNTVFSLTPATAPASTPAGSMASGRQVLRGVLAVGALLFLAGSLVYAYHLLEGLTHPHAVAPVPTPAPSVPPLPETPPVTEVISIEPTPPPSTTPQRQKPLLRSPEPISIAEEERPLKTQAERVNRAIDTGLAYLRKNFHDLPEYRNYLGLLGLTLLECGIDAEDASIQQIAGWIRSRAGDLTQTYELALAILFLDRLGEPRDRPLIRTFGNRLLHGRLDCGTWTYSCRIGDPKRFQPTEPLVLAWPGTPAHKHFNRPRRVVYQGDNSNTQFAILGLWVAQRHGVPSRSALLATEQYFRTTQATDGSWSYHPNLRLWPDSMTCAGLMSLAMRYGMIGGQGRDIRPDQPIHVHDGAVNQGLRALAQSLDNIRVSGNHIIGVQARDPLYFLWSLERMAVIYDLKTIGKQEWYPWAAEMLVETQRPDGRWQGMGEPVGTCFALLILKRSNFAKDLQLTVREAPSRIMPGLAGSSLPKAMEGIARPTGKPKNPPALSGTTIQTGSPTPLGPSITQTPESK